MLTFEQLEQIQAADGEQAFFNTLNAEQRRGYDDGNRDALNDEYEGDDPEEAANLAIEMKVRSMCLTFAEARKLDYIVGYWYGQVLCG